MRRSERVAAAAIAIMILPGILAILGLPAWFVVRAWPTMDMLDRVVFGASALSLALSIRPVIGPRLRSLYFGRMEAFTPFELILLTAPRLLSWGAVGHDWVVPALVVFGLVMFRFQIAVEERAKPRLAIPLREKAPDRIERRTTLVSAVGPLIPRRWRARCERLLWAWQARRRSATRRGIPRYPENGSP